MSKVYAVDVTRTWEVYVEIEDLGAFNSSDLLDELDYDMELLDEVDQRGSWGVEVDKFPLNLEKLSELQKLRIWSMKDA